MTGSDTRALVPLPGDGVLARYGDLVLLSEASEQVDALLEAVRKVADEGGDGRRLGRRLAGLLAVADDDDFPAFAAFGPAAAGVAVVVHGALSVTIDAGDKSVELDGRDAVTLVDRVVNADVSGVVGVLDGVTPTAPDRWSRLHAGVVRASGFRYVPSGGVTDATEAAGAVDAVPVGASAREPSGGADQEADLAGTQAWSIDDDVATEEVAGGADTGDDSDEDFASETGPTVPAAVAAGQPGAVRPGQQPEQSGQPVQQEQGARPPGTDEDDDAPDPIDSWASGALDVDPYDWNTANAEPGTAGVDSPQWADQTRAAAAEPPPDATATYVPDFDDETAPAAKPDAAPEQVASPTGQHQTIEPSETEFAAANGVAADDAFDAVLFVGPDSPSAQPAAAPLPTAGDDPGESTAEGAVSADPRPSVRGVQCSNDHFNDPRAEVCAVCGQPLEGSAEHTGPRPPLGVLVLDDGATFRLDTGYVVGREPDRDDDVARGKARALRVADPEGVVSRVHARVHLDGWEVTVIDVGSANGTHVCPPGATAWTRIPPHTAVAITPGTRVVFGRRGFRFESSRTQ